jgi:hypothetical protein
MGQAPHHAKVTRCDVLLSLAARLNRRRFFQIVSVSLLAAPFAAEAPQNVRREKSSTVDGSGRYPKMARAVTTQKTSNARAW